MSIGRDHGEMAVAASAACTKKAGVRSRPGSLAICAATCRIFVRSGDDDAALGLPDQLDGGRESPRPRPLQRVVIAAMPLAPVSEGAAAIARCVGVIGAAMVFAHRGFRLGMSQSRDEGQAAPARPLPLLSTIGPARATREADSQRLITILVLTLLRHFPHVALCP